MSPQGPEWAAATLGRLAAYTQGSPTPWPSPVRAHSTTHGPSRCRGRSARSSLPTTTAWLGASGWRFVDPLLVYRSNALELNDRRPAVVTWPVDFATLGFAPGTHVLLVALASATTPIAGASDNTLQSAERSVRTLIEGAAANAGNTQAAARLVRLDPVVVIPPP